MFSLFRPKQKPKAQTLNLPQLPPSLQAAATNIAARENMIQELRSLPDHGYAMLVTMIPEDGETSIMCMHWPITKDAMAMHGFYNYTVDYLNHRMNGG